MKHTPLPRWDRHVEDFMNTGMWEMEREERERTRLSLWLEHTTFKCVNCGYINGLWEWRDLWLEKGNPLHTCTLEDGVEYLFVHCDGCEDIQLLPLLEFCPTPIRPPTPEEVKACR